MALELLILAVHREEELRLGEREHDLQLLLAGVARDVHLVHPLVDHVGAQPHQVVDDAADRLFVAGNGVGADDDEVVRSDRHLAVVARRHARKRAHRLALAARRDEDDVLGAVAVDVVDVDHDALGGLEVAELGRDEHGVDHAAAGDGDLAAVFRGRLADELHAVDVGREGRNNDPLMLRLLEELVEALGDRHLGGGEAGALGVGRIGQQRKHALAAQLAEPREVDDVADDRRIVDFEVARLDDDARRGVDGQRDRVGDRVVDADELDLEAAKLDRLLRSDLHELDLAVESVLAQLVLNEPEGQPGGIDGDV